MTIRSAFRRALCPGRTLFLAVVPLAMPAMADDVTVVAPDLFESSAVVEGGRVVLDFARPTEHLQIDGDDLTTHSVLTYLHYGLASALELRLETESFIHQPVQSPGPGSTKSDFSSMALALKWNATQPDPDSYRPALALLVHADVGGAQRFLDGGAVSPSLFMMAEWQLGDDTRLGIMPGILHNLAEGERFWSGQLAVTLSHQLKPTLYGYVEMAAQQLAGTRYGGNLISYNTGLTWLPADKLQIDTFMSYGTGADQPDWRFNMGVFYRI